MSKKKERVLYLDVARSIAVLWIVGYWHLRVYCGKDYTDPYLSFPGDEWITKVVLGLFMFISGVLISKYTFDQFKKDCFSFYKKRFTRFYLLYAISIILLYMMEYNSLFGRFCLLTSLTMTSTYLLPQPRTLWFFSMIASFYIFTPFIMKKFPKSTLYSFFIIYGVSIILMLFLPKGIDPRFFWCFPLYWGGLIIGRNEHVLNVVTSKSVIGGISFIIIFFQLLIIVLYPNQFVYLDFFSLPFSILFILYISRSLSHPFITRITSFIAYSSMSAYLFHREIYIILMEVYNNWGFNLPYWFSAITFLPICLIISYFIQLAYDKSISSFSQKKTNK